MTPTYDYIIAGSGLGGLSLLFAMLNDEQLRKKKILVIDKVNKTQNDRTWCYWEKENSVFEPIVSHQWRTLRFLSPEVSKTFTMEHYRYKMIQGHHFYKYVLDFASQFSNVTFLQEKITSMDVEGENAFVTTKSGTYRAPFIFNSTGIFNPPIHTDNSLLQHFMGWVIKTEKPVFDSEVGTLMDFRLDQAEGTTFMYVLPTSEREALVEYTLFSPKVLNKEVYQTELRKYIKERLQIESYEILHKEFGVIPMSLAKFPRHIKGRIINLGTAGGFTKASTGYTFQFVQKHVQEIVAQLRENESPAIRPDARAKMFEWYDRTLLDVLLSHKLTGEQIFSSLFKKNSPENILAFLANESNFWDEFRIRNSVPMIPFMTSGIKQMLIKR